MIVSKTRNAPGWATKEDSLIPNGVKCNENVIWVSVLRLKMTSLKLIIMSKYNKGIDCLAFLNENYVYATAKISVFCI